MGARLGEEQILGFRRAIEQFLDARERPGRGQSACFNGIAGAFEIVPRKMLHVRPQNQVSVAFPRFKLVLLCGAHRAGYNLKDVLGSAAAAVLNSYRNPEDTVCANLASGDRGHLGNEASISQAASADLDRFKEAGESAAGANRIDQRPL